MQQLAGGRQLLGAFALTFVASMVLTFVPIFTEARKRGQKGKLPVHSYFQTGGFPALIYFLVPVIIAAVPLAVRNHPRRREVWKGIGFLFAFWVVLVLGQLGIFYLVPLGVMVWGLRKASQLEGPVPKLRGPFGRRRGGPEADDGVVDATGDDLDGHPVGD